MPAQVRHRPHHVLTGEIADAPDAPSPADHPEYLAKYGDFIANGPWRTPEVFAETYSAPLRFTPTRLRGH